MTAGSTPSDDADYGRLGAGDVERRRREAYGGAARVVGGSPGISLLGLRDPDAATDVRHVGAIVVRARRDTQWGMVQGFDWGDLTSGSKFHALWVILLLNVAGWAHPAKNDEAYPGQTTTTHALVIALGCILTATWTLWLADMLVAYPGYQWIPRAVGSGEHVVPVLPFGWAYLTLSATATRALGSARVSRWL